MAYCYLEEAWGADYKSSLSPATLTPDWLNKCKETEKKTTSQLTSQLTSQPNSQPIKEHFTNNHSSNRSSNDDDLRVDYDEFNLPLHWDAPQGISSMDDDYYRLINNDDNEEIKEQFTTNYAEEQQFSETFTRECAQTFPVHVRHHLKKCSECRKRLIKFLNELEYKNDDKEQTEKTSNTEQPANGIKKMFPKQFGPIIDLIVFIAFGIFIIYILDAFVRLGKNLK